MEFRLKVSHDKNELETCSRTACMMTGIVKKKCVGILVKITSMIKANIDDIWLYMYVALCWFWWGCPKGLKLRFPSRSSLSPQADRLPGPPSCHQHRQRLLLEVDQWLCRLRSRLQTQLRRSESVRVHLCEWCALAVQRGATKMNNQCPHLWRNTEPQGIWRV